jgi:hypothetical protein
VAHSLCRRSSCSASVSRANALDGSRSERGTQIQLPRTWTRCGLGCRSDHATTPWRTATEGSADLEGRADYAVTMPEPTGTSVYGAVNAKPSRSRIPRGYAVSCVCVCSQEPLPSHSKCGGRKPMGVRVPPPPLVLWHNDSGPVRAHGCSMSKGDRGPDRWMPPDTTCDSVERGQRCMQCRGAKGVFTAECVPSEAACRRLPRMASVIDPPGCARPGPVAHGVKRFR